MLHLDSISLASKMESIHCLPHRIWSGIGWQVTLQWAPCLSVLAKHWLSLGRNSQSMWIQAFQCVQKPVYHYSVIVSFEFSAFASFLHWASERWYRYGSILLLHSTLLATLLCLVSYKQCSMWLLKVLHKCYNMDMLRFYWCIHTLPWALCTLGTVHIYQSKPWLPYYNI